MEELHQLIESYIDTKMKDPSVNPNALKFSLNDREARDFTKPDAPLLIKGEDAYVTFKTRISRSFAAALGNKSKRRTGTVEVRIYTKIKDTDRTRYSLLDVITSFLERTNHQGVLFRNVSEAGDFEIGSWRVDTWTVDFIKTVNIL